MQIVKQNLKRNCDRKYSRKPYAKQLCLEINGFDPGPQECLSGMHTDPKFRFPLYNKFLCLIFKYDLNVDNDV